MFHTPLGIRKAGCFVLLCVSQTPEMHPRPCFGVFGVRGGPLKRSSRLRKGIRRHPRVRCAHVVRHVKVLGQSFPYENTKREKTFFLPPDEKGTPTIFKPAWPRRTYDPQELTYDLRPFKVPPTTLKPACQERSYEPHRPT